MKNQSILVTGCTPPLFQENRLLREAAAKATAVTKAARVVPFPANPPQGLTALSLRSEFVKYCTPHQTVRTILRESNRPSTWRTQSRSQDKPGNRASLPHRCVVPFDSATRRLAPDEASRVGRDRPYWRGAEPPLATRCPEFLERSAFDSGLVRNTPGSGVGAPIAELHRRWPRDPPYESRSTRAMKESHRSESPFSTVCECLTS